MIQKVYRVFPRCAEDAGSANKDIEVPVRKQNAFSAYLENKMEVVSKESGADPASRCAHPALGPEAAAHGRGFLDVVCDGDDHDSDADSALHRPQSATANWRAHQLDSSGHGSTTVERAWRGGASGCAVPCHRAPGQHGECAGGRAGDRKALRTRAGA